MMDYVSFVPVRWSLLHFRRNLPTTVISLISFVGGVREYSSGSDFTTRVITANDGENITMKVMHFSQQRSHAMSILAASGTISNVTLCNSSSSSSSGGTLNHEGSSRLICLGGSFVFTDSGISKKRYDT